jgi:hypothetical protein
MDEIKKAREEQNKELGITEEEDLATSSTENK